MPSDYDHITSADQLARLCDELAGAERVAFDTEFVSEHTYRSELCLVQVATERRLAVIDALRVGDLTPFWRQLADGPQETIVHAGREELGFCLEAVGRRPARLFDVQIAAALVGYEYPAGYGSLLSKILSQSPRKGETRTDWRRRPLSRQQVDYALDDVRYLHALRDELGQRLEALKRMSWMQLEMDVWQQEVEAARSRDRWRRVSGVSGLSARSLAVVRELWKWRDAEARRRDWPAKRVLRDDLLVELAKRRSADPKQIVAVRGLERGDLKRVLPEIAQAIQRALALPETALPTIVRREVPDQINLLGQFLSSALTSLCRAAQVAPSLVGTASDVRDLIAHRLGYGDGQPPVLAQGWRAEVVGQWIENLLAGKVSIRIHDPLSDHPLVFEPGSDSADGRSQEPGSGR